MRMKRVRTQSATADGCAKPDVVADNTRVRKMVKVDAIPSSLFLGQASHCALWLSWPLSRIHVARQRWFPLFLVEPTDSADDYTEIRKM